MTIETAEVLPHYFGMPKFYPSTVGWRSFTPLLQDTEILPLHCEKVKLYLSITRHQSSTSPSNHCRTAKLHLTTARQPNYQRNIQLPLLHWTSTTTLTENSDHQGQQTWEWLHLTCSIQQTWIMSQMDTEIWETLYGFKTEQGRRWSLAQHAYILHGWLSRWPSLIQIHREGNWDLWHNQKKVRWTFCSTKKQHLWMCSVQLKGTWTRRVGGRVYHSFIHTRTSLEVQSPSWLHNTRQNYCGNS